MQNESDHYFYRLLLAKVQEIMKADQGVESMYSHYSGDARAILKTEFSGIIEGYEIVQKHRMAQSGKEWRPTRGPSLFTADAVVELTQRLDVPMNKAREQYLRDRFEKVQETGATVDQVFSWLAKAQLTLVPKEEPNKPKL